MAREKLPDRRASLTMRIPFAPSGGRTINLIVTVGWKFDDPEHRIREVFCASFSAGSDLQAIVMDACILLARLYQHGDSPAEIAKTLSSDSPSLLCTIARAVVGAFADGAPEAR